MIQNIIKRDGRIVEFNSSKISTAICKAGEATGEFGERESVNLALRVVSLAHDFAGCPTPEVEQIQDIVERVLLDSPYHKSAKAYILYREQHSRLREMAAAMNADLVDSYVGKLDWKVRENSNMCYSLQGLNNYISSDITAEYWLNRIYPPEIRDAHKNGDIHIHDLNLLAVYCVGWDLQDLLRQGFTGVSGKVEASPPNHFRTALGQIANFFYTLQGEAAGAQALSSFDTLLAPFVRYDGLEYPEVKQALQEFVFNINIPTRVGFQTPFTNITMDLNPPAALRDQSVIIGGCEMEETYKVFQPEIDMINRAFAEVMMGGDAKGRVFTFPIPTYNITADFDWDNPNLNMLWKMTGKYGVPEFSNFISSDMSPEDVRSMCCRLRLDNRELIKRGGGLFGASPLTGSIGVVTVNLPRIGYLTETRDEFFSVLKDQVNIAAKSLLIKRKVLEKFTEKNLYPYAKHYLKRIKEGGGRYWKNHFSTIGIIGMNEACLNFMGKDIASDDGQAFALETMDFLRSLISELQAGSDDLFNLEATPAEGTSYRLAMIDKKEYPGILCANEADSRKGGAPYYTNSTQLPVNYTDDVFEALFLQDKIQTKYNGGTAMHLFLGEQVRDIETVKGLVRKTAENFHIPTFTLTPTFSICPSHGYLDGEQHLCPDCGEPTEVYSRVVGYLRPVGQWNVGKQAEFGHRKTFSPSVAGEMPKASYQYRPPVEKFQTGKGTEEATG